MLIKKLEDNKIFKQKMHLGTFLPENKINENYSNQKLVVVRKIIIYAEN